MPTRLILPLLALLCLGCSRQPHPVTRGMYYWKTVFSPTAYERKRMATAGCRDLYLRCFDIAKESDGKVRPAGIVRNLSDSLRGLRIVPVIYITQDALNASAGPNLAGLAANMAHLLSSLWKTRPAPDEIQIDCDWTSSNRDTYFGLLRCLREQPFIRNKTLSCTIRLHQVKFQSKSGIPPVDRGLLMCYNMGNLKKPGAHNSILNPQLAADYLQHLDDYPLTLDVALPLFRWSLLFRGERLRGIMRDVMPETIASSPLFRKAGTNLYTCLADSSFMGYELRRGDIVRTETAERNDVLRMADLVSRKLRNDSRRILLFHCDSLTLAKHPDDELEAIYSAFD